MTVNFVNQWEFLVTRIKASNIYSKSSTKGHILTVNFLHQIKHLVISEIGWDAVRLHSQSGLIKHITAFLGFKISIVVFLSEMASTCFPLFFNRTNLSQWFIEIMPFCYIMILRKLFIFYENGKWIVFQKK